MIDLQKILSYGSAAAVVGTGAVVGGGAVVDNLTDGPAKRQEIQLQQIKELVAEEVYTQLKDAWPQTSGPVKGLRLPDATK